MVISRQRLVVAIVLAIFAPGLGRVIVGKVWSGILLFLVFMLLLRINVIELWWLHWLINFTVWSFFASLDVGFVVQSIKKEDAN
jgi:TM2 domain-containing membrane protein YozV